MTACVHPVGGWHRSVEVLAASAERLATIVSALSPPQLEQSAYPENWTIADVVSHLGSSAVLAEIVLDDTLADGSADLAALRKSTWTEWDAKPSAAKVRDAVAADRRLIARLHALTDEERTRLHYSVGPYDFDAAGFVGLRINEHAVHVWDIAVSLDPEATITKDAVELMVDDLALVAMLGGRPAAVARHVRVSTSEPTRFFDVALGPDLVSLGPSSEACWADVELPAEAFIRLVYGRLDREHTPPFTGSADRLEQLRRAFPGV